MAKFLIKTETVTKVVVSGTNEFECWSKLEREYPNSKIILSDKTEDGYLEFKIIKTKEYKIEADNLKEATSKAPKNEILKVIICI